MVYVFVPSGFRSVVIIYLLRVLLLANFFVTLTNSKQCGSVVRTKGTGHNNIIN